MVMVNSSTPKKSMRLVLSLLSLAQLVNGNAGIFTYYETPLFKRIGNKGVVMASERAVGAGPSQWPNILFPPQIAPSGNQCGGIGQRTGYGQSPIVVPAEARDSCDTGLEGYAFEGGSCTWEDLSFRIITNGVIIGAKLGATCSLGRMHLPGKTNYFNALQFHIHTSSEHSIDGTYYPAELHVVHQEETGESFAVFGMFIDQSPDDQDHETFEYFLKGWEATAQQTEEYCAVHPNGTGQWTANSAFTSRQMKLQCPAVADGIDSKKIDPKRIELDSATGLLKPKNGDIFNNASVSHLYRDLPTPGYGIYTYRGGLTTPPCTEIVNWNLLDTPLYASKSQIDRLYKRILCFVEISTCRHATIANEAGFTNRPVQPLHGRTVLHRCPNITSVGIDGALPDPIPQSFDTIETQHRRCILGGDGGPLRMCWNGEYHNHFALLYPWFVMAMGLAVFYVLARYCNWLPYTAVMFFLGMVMGIYSVTEDNPDQLTASIRIWQEIDSETLLLGFLPGLLFRDAYSANVFLFKKAFWQCIIMAFPMVLAGTFLTGLFGHYVLPYEWSWALSLTFGAILSATDPVAVSALLNEVGAPPRLKIHISGESLLNDGSAIVFFTLFSQIFFFEFGIPNFGTDIDVATGFGLFFRMSFGAVAIGIAFGLALLGVIYILDRRFHYEESVVQVTASITAAYLCYYTAEAVLGMSGVIAVVTLGLMTKYYAESLFSDTDMMEKFWTLVEHILNSLLFTLGGNVWGRIISNADPEHIVSMTFQLSDWGYMILTYVMLLAIRSFLVFCFYPIISRTGLKSNWKEALFMSWGGLRGAVGIALAVALDREVQEETLRPDPRRRFTTQLFGITGGVAFMTLLINGTLAGPLLKKLGLSNIGEARKAIVDRHHTSITLKMFADSLKLLGVTRFSGIDFGHVKKHVSFFKHLTFGQIKYVVKQNKETTPVLDYVQPNLSSFKPFLAPEEYDEIVNLSKVDIRSKIRAIVSLAGTVDVGKRREELLEYARRTDSDTPAVHDGEATEPLIELRKVFIELLSRSYEEQFENGEIDVRNVSLIIALKTSIAVMKDEVAQGAPIGDWFIIAQLAMTGSTKKWLSNVDKLIHKKKKHFDSEDCEHAVPEQSNELELEEIKSLVYQAFGFMEAHKRAQREFTNEFCTGKLLTEDELKVLDESIAQVQAAEAVLKAFGQGTVERMLVHLLCTILLSKAADFVGKLTKKGMLSDQEAEHFLEEIEEDMNHVGHCQSTYEKMQKSEDYLCFIHKQEDQCLETSERELVKGDESDGGGQNEEVDNMRASQVDNNRASRVDNNRASLIVM